MKFGVAASGITDPRLLEQIARTAEELGYSSFLVTDHYMNDHHLGTVDCWVLLSYLAAKTRTIKLGTCVTPIPLRSPAILAKMLSTLDNLSNGRAILGAGSGWYKPEFEAFSKWLGTKERVGATFEGIQLMKRLWIEKNPVDFEGEYLSCKGAWVEPKPVQKPSIPVWFGTSSPRSLAFCGRYADGWLPIGPRWFSIDYPKPEKYAVMRKTIATQLERRETQVKDFAYSCLIDYAEKNTLAKDLEEYARAGMNYCSLGLSQQRGEIALQRIEEVAHEIIPSYS